MFSPELRASFGLTDINKDTCGDGHVKNEAIQIIARMMF